MCRPDGCRQPNAELPGKLESAVTDQAELAWITRGGLGRSFEIVVPGIEVADELIEPEGRLPDFEQQAAPRAASLMGRAAIDGGIVTLVAPAAAVELARSDFQGLTDLQGHCNPWQRS